MNQKITQDVIPRGNETKPYRGLRIFTPHPAIPQRVEAEAGDYAEIKSPVAKIIHLRRQVWA